MREAAVNNKKVFQFDKNQSPLYCFCHNEVKRALQLFCKCSNLFKIPWNRLFFETDLDFPGVILQTVLFYFFSECDNNLNVLQKDILLIFKLYVYQ